MAKSSTILARFPELYDISQTSTLYKLIDAISAEFDIQSSQIDALNAMIGINTTLGGDLDSRWGSLLSVPRNTGEGDEEYRSRLKNSVTSLSGGTAYSIKYAIAVGLGINNDQAAMDKMITIYDAWNYPGEISGIDKTYCNIICEIDLDYTEYTPAMESIVMSRAHDSKASGTVVHFTVKNYAIILYIKLDDLMYNYLDAITYDKLG